jgi:hypothetical protein
MVDVLKVPDALAGFRVKAEQRFGEEVVPQTMPPYQSLVGVPVGR